MSANFNENMDINNDDFDLEDLELENSENDNDDKMIGSHLN